MVEEVSQVQDRRGRWHQRQSWRQVNNFQISWLAATENGMHIQFRAIFQSASCIFGVPRNCPCLAQIYHTRGDCRRNAIREMDDKIERHLALKELYICK